MFRWQEDFPEIGENVRGKVGIVPGRLFIAGGRHWVRGRGWLGSRDSWPGSGICYSGSMAETGTPQLQMGDWCQRIFLPSARDFL